MTVVVIRRSGQEKENVDNALLDYLDAVFGADLSHIDNYVDVRHNPNAVKEVENMNGLGYSIYEQGMAEGIEQGISQGITQGISQGFDLLGKLIDLLIKAGRVDDAQKAATDESIREQFLREFHLIE